MKLEAKIRKVYKDYSEATLAVYHNKTVPCTTKGCIML